MWANPRGQFTIVALIMLFVAILVFKALYPTLDEAIDDFEANYSSEDPETTTLLQLTPFLILIFVVLGGLWYALPHYQPRYE